MSMNQKNRFIIFAFIFILLSILSCGDLIRDDLVPVPKVIDPLPAYVKIINQSQWELEHVYMYPWEKMFENNKSLLSSPVKPLASREYCMPADDYYLSVTRKKNQDGPLLQFALASPIEFKINAKLEFEFLENEFRLERIDSGINKNDWKKYSEKLETLARDDEGEVIVLERNEDKEKLKNCVSYKNDIVMMNLEENPCVCPWDGPSGELYFMGTYACSPDDELDTSLTLYEYDDTGRELIRLSGNDNISSENSYSKISYYLEPGTYYIQSENTKYTGKGCYAFKVSTSSLDLSAATTKLDDSDDVFLDTDLLEDLQAVDLETESLHYDNDEEGGDDWFKIVIPYSN